MSLITIDCHAPTSPTTRKLLFLPVDIPTRYYPVALLGLFTVFMGVRGDMIVSTGVGYLYVRGFDSRIRICDERVRGLERGVCRGWGERQGFIKLDEAGGEGYLPTSTFDHGGGGVGEATRAAPPAGGWNLASASPLAAPGVVLPPSFAGVGQTVGSFGGVPVVRDSEENPTAAREAMLRAAERRARGGGS